MKKIWQFVVMIITMMVCSSFPPIVSDSEAGRYNSGFYMRNQMQRQQQIMQQQRQQRMMQQQREQQRRQQEQMRQQRLRQQQVMRERQRQMQQKMQQRQQMAMKQRKQMLEKQRQLQQQRERKILQQKKASAQKIQKGQQQKLVQQKQVLRQQRLMKDRKDKLQRLKKQRLQRQKQDKARNQNNTVTIASLSSRYRANNSTSSKAPKSLSPKQLNKSRLDKRDMQRASVELAKQKNLIQSRIQKIAQTKKSLSLKTGQQKTKQKEQSKTQKFAQNNFRNCKGATCKVGSCSFHGDTQVLTKSGFKAISDLSVGKTRVWSRNEITGESGWKLVTNHYFNLYEETVTIIIKEKEGGFQQSIISNRIHPFYVLGTSATGNGDGAGSKQKWVQAQNLQAGDILLNDNNSVSLVVQTEIKTESLKAFNITVDGYHTYFIKGFLGESTRSVWVHNDCNERTTGLAKNNKRFAIHPRVAKQLNDPRMGRLQGKLNDSDLQKLINDKGAKRLLDNRTGHINVIQDVNGKLLRITVPRDSMKIISVGPIRSNQVNNLIKKGDYTPLK